MYLEHNVIVLLSVALLIIFNAVRTADRMFLRSPIAFATITWFLPQMTIARLARDDQTLLAQKVN